MALMTLLILNDTFIFAKSQINVSYSYSICFYFRFYCVFVLFKKKIVCFLQFSIACGCEDGVLRDATRPHESISKKN